MNKYLDKFIPGETGTVIKIKMKESAHKRRMFDMGITPGTDITLVKVAPLGDPMELHLRGYALSIRKTEAQAILMEIAGDIK